MIETLVTMLIKRWYVWCFLISYFLIAHFYWGWRQTLKFLFLGYLLAWGSEALSIRHGFPYGLYQYHYEAMPHEWMIFGVPFWDSLSYVFLAFFSLTVATLIHAKYRPQHPLIEIQNSWLTLLMAACYMMMIDIVIDPVANQGEKWFLGKIYHYPEGGAYFGVPLSNFAGWWLTALVIYIFNRMLWPAKESSLMERFLPLGTLLYFMVFIFNFLITWWIGDYKLLFADILWGTLMFAIVYHASRYKNKIPLHF
ncbi:MAG: carotenoid biosynthesis protein [Deltaproteobacteria bacterium]|nr:carotenoid biosynthesis protein [Deltaproteobacteria bacterium]